MHVPLSCIIYFQIQLLTKKIEKEEYCSAAYVINHDPILDLYLTALWSVVAHELQYSDQNHIYMYMPHQEH